MILKSLKFFIDPPKSWQDYLRRRQQMGGKWPKCGAIPIDDVDLTGARLVEATASGNEAELVLQPSDERLASVRIRLRPAQSELPGAEDFSGFSQNPFPNYLSVDFL